MIYMFKYTKLLNKTELKAVREQFRIFNTMKYIIFYKIDIIVYQLVDDCLLTTITKKEIALELRIGFKSQSTYSFLKFQSFFKKEIKCVILIL